MKLTKDDALKLAAGYVDGESCIMWKLFKNETKRDSGSLAIKVESGDVLNLQLLQALFGGELKPTKARAKDNVRCYWWQICGERAFYALIDLEPYLLVKRPQLIAALQFYRELNMLKSVKSEGYRDEVEKLHHKAYANLRLLKKHNYLDHTDEEKTYEKEDNPFTITTQSPGTEVQRDMGDARPSASFLPY